jgi:hypothetical protein
MSSRLENGSMLSLRKTAPVLYSPCVFVIAEDLGLVDQRKKCQFLHSLMICCQGLVQRLVGLGFVGGDDGDGVFLRVVADADIVVGVHDHLVGGGDVVSHDSQGLAGSSGGRKVAARSREEEQSSPARARGRAAGYSGVVVAAAGRGKVVMQRGCVKWETRRGRLEALFGKRGAKQKANTKDWRLGLRARMLPTKGKEDPNRDAKKRSE